MAEASTSADAPVPPSPISAAVPADTMGNYDPIYEVMLTEKADSTTADPSTEPTEHSDALQTDTAIAEPSTEPTQNSPFSYQELMEFLDGMPLHIEDISMGLQDDAFMPQLWKMTRAECLPVVSGTADPSSWPASLEAYLIKKLEEKKWSNPTPVQSHMVHLVQLGHSLISTSESHALGKTVGSLVTLANDALKRYNSCFRVEKKSAPHAIFLSDTHEAAQAAVGHLRHLCGASNVHIGLCHGDLKAIVGHILCATPEELFNLVEKGKITVAQLKLVVVDNGEKLLNGNFEDHLQEGLFRMIREAKAIPSYAVEDLRFIINVTGALTDFMKMTIKKSFRDMRLFDIASFDPSKRPDLCNNEYDFELMVFKTSSDESAATLQDDPYKGLCGIDSVDELSAVEYLWGLLEEFGLKHSDDGRLLVFTDTRDSAEFIYKKLKSKYVAFLLESDKSNKDKDQKEDLAKGLAYRHIGILHGDVQTSTKDDIVYRGQHGYHDFIIPYGKTRVLITTAISSRLAFPLKTDVVILKSAHAIRDANFSRSRLDQWCAMASRAGHKDEPGYVLTYVLTDRSKDYKLVQDIYHLFKRSGLTVSKTLDEVSTWCGVNESIVLQRESEIKQIEAESRSTGLPVAHIVAQRNSNATIQATDA